MHDLADDVTGEKTGRALPDQVTLFKSVGLAIEDVSLAVTLLKQAVEENVGVPLPF